MVDYRLLDLATLQADPAWWAIYEEGFPVTEREPAVRVLQSVGDGSSVAFRAERAGETVGIGVSTLLRTLPGALLAYFAIASEHRARRIGGPFFDYLHQATDDHLATLGLDSLGLVIEVEDPHLAPDAAEALARERRIAFYQRRGGRLLAERYVMPPLDGTTLVPMRLMLRPARDGDSASMAALVRAVYFEKYAALNDVPASLLHALLQEAGRSADEAAGETCLMAGFSCERSWT